ncbi:hypothetical protein BC835DRAFT_1412959 [Cytidiella melzeri]|nr:hypothetical protein BC835DRAFT_1412959 [Cytidiella melzeri]
MELKTECIVAEGTPARNDHKKKKKWYLQSYLMGIPQITVGYRDDKFVLRKVDSVPLAQLYRPPDNTLENAFTYAFETLQQLRNFCSTQRDKPGSRAWKVTVRRGALLDNPHQL